MESHYPRGLFCPEREEEECRQHQQPLQQPPPPHQQHFASYSIDLPYHAHSQHQSEFPLDQPFRAFSQSHPAAPMLSMVKHDSGHVAPTQILPQPSLPVRGQRVKPSSVLANYPLAINQTHKAFEERNIPPITPHEDVSGRNTLPVALPLSVVLSCDGAIATPTCESIVARAMPLTTSQSSVPERNIQPTSVLKSVVESRSLPITLNKSAQSSDTQQQDQPALVSTPSSPCSRSSFTESQPSLSQQVHASPPFPDDPVSDAPLLATVHLKKTVPLDLPSSCALHVSKENDVIRVVAKEMMEKGAEFGPIKGSLLDVEEGWSKETSWEICVSGRVYHYIDGRKTWMSHVRCAQSEEEQNMEAYQFYGEIYFRNTKVIEPGSELKVFYGKEYMKHIGIKTELNELDFDQDAQKFCCSLCKHLFSSSKMILRHITCEHTDGKEKDKLSLKSRKIGVKKHIKVTIGSKHLFKARKRTRKKKDSEFKCETCKKVFASSGRLKAHEQFHDYDQDHTCPVCGKRQKNAQAWAKHMMLHKPVNEARTHKCSECNGRYKSKAALRKHAHQIHGYPCRLCSERFARRGDCRKHELTHQAFIPPPAAVEYLVAEAAPDKPLDMLGKSANYHQLRYQCRYCPNRYSDHRTAKIHEREVHTREGTFKCSQCTKVFSCASRLKAHLLIHEQTYIYRCTFCPRSFASESALNSHQGEHNGLKPVKCDVCGKGFKSRRQFLAHKRRVHSNRPKRYFCSFCSFGFAERSDLRRHEERHRGIRRYSCPECEKTFTSNTSLTAHVQALHSKEKPFSCAICGISFALNYKYTLHMVKHNLQVNGSSISECSTSTTAPEIVSS
ncbi:histone-lysine N-methyltransferase MECOM-like [Lytechinus pictus]|uniref:histone-lysine N-methyltransferase MECOM-like n=1 Tax=Lytechinus pictus TaxID=7653 RepID=UPI0030B9D391